MDFNFILDNATIEKREETNKICCLGRPNSEIISLNKLACLS